MNFLCRLSSVARRPLISFSQEMLDQSLPNLVCNICRVGRKEHVNFMIPIPWENFYGAKSVKMIYLLQNLLFYSWT